MCTRNRAHPSSLILGYSRCPRPFDWRANPDVETTDWRARRGKTAQRVRREGTAIAVSYPYPRVVLRRSPVANVLYFPFSEAPPITVGGRRKGPVGRRPRCRASRYRVRCRADPVADRSRAGHDGGAKNAGHGPLHDVGQIADALYALLGGAVFVWARSAPRWWRRSCRPSPSRGASVKSRASAVHWPCIRSRRDGSTGSPVIAVRCSSRACRTLCRSTSPPRCSTLCCCRWLQDS